MKFSPLFNNAIAAVTVYLLLSSLHQTFLIFHWIEHDAPIVENEVKSAIVPQPVSPGHKIFFIHIPKTAGTTLRHILLKYAEEHKSLKVCPYFQEIMFIKAEKKLNMISNYDILYGHYNFLRVKHAAGAMYRYLTVVREPLDHHLSTYFYNYRSALKNRQKIPKFWEWLRNIKLDNTSNPQCTFLGVTIPFYTSIRLKDFDWVATTDTFDEGMVYLKDLLRFSDVTYERRKVIEGRPTIDSLSPVLKEMIQKVSPCDFALYENAKKLLKENILRRYESEEAFQKLVQDFRNQLPEPKCKDDDPRAGRPGSCARLDLSQYKDRMKNLLSDPNSDNIKEIEDAIIARPTPKINPVLLPGNKPAGLKVGPDPINNKDLKALMPKIGLDGGKGANQKGKQQQNGKQKPNEKANIAKKNPNHAQVPAKNGQQPQKQHAGKDAGGGVAGARKKNAAAPQLKQPKQKNPANAKAKGKNNDAQTPTFNAAQRIKKFEKGDVVLSKEEKDMIRERERIRKELEGIGLPEEQAPEV